MHLAGCIYEELPRPAPPPCVYRYVALCVPPPPPFGASLSASLLNDLVNSAVATLNPSFFPPLYQTCSVAATA